MRPSRISFILLWIAITFVSGWPAWTDIFGEKQCDPSDVSCFGEKLYALYDQKMKHIEEATLFHEVGLPPLTKSHFLNTKPIISLFGQYSSGKTTFSNLLIGGEYSGQHTSLAASTSEFTFLSGTDGALSKQACDDEHACKTPGVSDGKYFVMNGQTPFNIYQHFSGTEVIKSIKAAFVKSPFLEDVYLVDTPGIISNSKDSCNYLKFYDALFFQSDLIVFLFDPYKPSDLDCAQKIFTLLRNCITKVRFVINKADALTYRSLLDVYGAIQYNLGISKIFETLETNRFYLTSFNDKSCVSYDESLCELISSDEEELLSEFDGLKNEKYRIQSKIQSLNERIQLVKANMKRVESYVQLNCNCGYISCQCKDHDKGKGDKRQECYQRELGVYVKALERKRARDKLMKLMDLSPYKEQLNDAQQDLNNIAEKFENLTAKKKTPWKPRRRKSRN